MHTSAHRLRQVLAAVVGNALEWYDFVVYAAVGVIIARLFFPHASEYAALMLTFATFGAGFVMRPIGGVVLGLYADRKGRKAAMQLIILLMTVAVAMVAFAPSYAAIGAGAPLLIVLARLLQGFAAGGEFSSATSFLFEIAPAHRRGYYGSLQMVGQVGAALGGAFVAALVTQHLSAAQVDAWAWRLPFLLGLLIGPVGLYIRRHLEETDEFRDFLASAAAPAGVATVMRGHARAVLVSFLLVVGGTSTYYVVLLYMPTYAKTQLGLPLAQALQAQTIALTWMLVVTPLSGYVSDRIGRRPVLLAATIGFFVLPYPLLRWLQGAPSFGHLLTLQLGLCTTVGAYFGAYGTTMAEQFPTRVRSTGMGIAYNFAVMLFGGFAPFLITWIMDMTGSHDVPAFYIMFGALAGFGATCLIEGRSATAGAVVVAASGS
jgi:MHS family proline/betaine transporter-like MFS transporter